MRDSNPRGLAPNPLSKSALARSQASLSVHPCVDRRQLVAEERQRTIPTETRTETMLMIKVPTATRPASRGVGESKAAAVPGCSRPGTRRPLRSRSSAPSTERPSAPGPCIAPSTETICDRCWGAWLDSDMQGGSVDELLGVAVERPALDQLQVEVGRTLEDRVHPVRPEITGKSVNCT
jgi:hypothetical protein